MKVHVLVPSTATAQPEALQISTFHRPQWTLAWTPGMQNKPFHRRSVLDTNYTKYSWTSNHGTCLGPKSDVLAGQRPGYATSAMGMSPAIEML